MQSLKDFLLEICQNKNILMFITAVIYMIALYSVLSSKLALIAFLITILFIACICLNLFKPKYLFIWIFVFYFGVINTYSRLNDVDKLLNLAPLNAEITGKIVTIPQSEIIKDFENNENRKTKFFFNVKNIKFDEFEYDLNNVKTLVTLDSNEDEVNSLNLYKTVSFKGRLSAPFKAGNPSQFDYGNYLRNQNAYSVFYAKEFKILEGSLKPLEKFMQRISDYREKILSIHSQYLKSPYLEILGGIVFGDDAVSPPQNIKQSFINSGLLHILAASGMNVAFIYGFFYSIMSLFRINFRIKVISGIFMIIIYALMTGLGASVIRAACMLVFVLIGRLIDRDAHSISLLSFVALLMLIYNPMYINDVGFQLSFIVTFGILIMAPLIARYKSKILNFMLEIVSIPIIAQLWVIPIQIFYFNNISLYSVFANIISVPIIMVLSFGGFISSLLCFINPIANFVCQIFDFILSPFLILIVNISDFWGKLPHSSISTTHPSVLQILLYYGILLFVSGLFYKNVSEKHSKKLVISIFAFFFIILLTLIPHANRNLEITAFDVGNADSFLIKTPKNEYLMIDTGRAKYKNGKSQAEIILLKYFKDRGIKKIDKVIITHFDNDHCGGMVDIMNNLKVDEVYVNDIAHDSYAAKSIYETAEKNGVKVILAKNQQIVYDKSDLLVTNYIASGNKTDNDNSVLILIKYKDFSMLFTGDAGEVELNQLLNQLPKNVTVLKVPHHGAPSCLTPNIVKYLNPKYSIVSVGENKFGHPSIYTLKLLKNSKILRTDIHNSIRLIVNNKGFNALTYDIKRRKYLKAD